MGQAVNGSTVDSIKSAAEGLRKRHAETLAQLPQETVVAALAALGRRWRDPAYALRREAETWLEPYPFEMVQVSLDALLDSLTPEKLWDLITAEGVSEALGYPVIGHVIAGNTPLLAWVSIIRALLVRSASLVKLPSNASAHWAELFHRSFQEVAPEITACVCLMQWPGGTSQLDAALCADADLVMAHGSDATLRDLRAICPSGTPFIGYGHRVSFGVLLPEADIKEAARGFAKDVLLYDQGGCLSPQTIFVVGGRNNGDGNNVPAFSSVLAEALLEAAQKYPLPVRSARAAGAVTEARALAWMEDGATLWEDPARRWTVIARPGSGLVASPTFGVVSVQPLASLDDLPEALGLVADRLQGCAAAGTLTPGSYLPGISYLCRPGQLQAPPLAWRQDGRDVLRVLLPPGS